MRRELSSKVTEENIENGEITLIKNSICTIFGHNYKAKYTIGLSESYGCAISKQKMVGFEDKPILIYSRFENLIFAHALMFENIASRNNSVNQGLEIISSSIHVPEIFSEDFKGFVTDYKNNGNSVNKVVFPVSDEKRLEHYLKNKEFDYMELKKYLFK